MRNQSNPSARLSTATPTADYSLVGNYGVNYTRLTNGGLSPRCLVVELGEESRKAGDLVRHSEIYTTEAGERLHYSEVVFYRDEDGDLMTTTRGEIDEGEYEREGDCPLGESTFSHDEIVKHWAPLFVLIDENDGLVETITGERISEGEAVFSDHEGGYLSEDESFHCDESSDYYFDLESILLHDGRHIWNGLDYNTCIDGEHFLDGDCDFYYVENVGEYVHCDSYELHHCEQCESLYYGDEPCCESPSCGDGIVGDYHSSNPYAILGAYSSKFTIGFEIERNSLLGRIDEEGDDCQEVDDCEIVAGTETDSSCGVEVVTHILPLASDSKSQVFAAIDECSDWLDDDVEANKSCGGHITIAGAGLTREKLTPYLSLWFALFRYRLNTTYCRQNTDGKGSNTKYSPLNHKGGNMYELRIPCAVRSSDSLKFRYSLMLSMVEAIDKGETARKWCTSLETEKLLNTVYSEQKTLEMIILAGQFEKYLVVGEVSEEVKKFLP